MSFLLLGRDAEDRVYLVSDRAFTSRSDALHELERITGSDGFAGWDHEIMLVDDATAAPVLLVRPAAAAEAPEPGTTESAAAEPEAAEQNAGEDAAAEPDAEEGAEPASHVETEDASDLKAALVRTTQRLEAEGISAPESVGMPEEISEPVESEPPPAQADEAPATWPWDSLASDSEDGLSVLDEPGDDEGSLVRAAGDDETMAIARPVIMGAYGETPQELIEALATDEGVDAPRTIVEPVGVESPAVPAIDPASDYVDLSAIESVRTEPSPIDSMTCDDCVYVETCPNKGQSAPESCGSFQWK